MGCPLAAMTAAARWWRQCPQSVKACRTVLAWRIAGTWQKRPSSQVPVQGLLSFLIALRKGCRPLPPGHSGHARPNLPHPAASHVHAPELFQPGAAKPAHSRLPWPQLGRAGRMHARSVLAGLLAGGPQAWRGPIAPANSGTKACAPAPLLAGHGAKESGACAPGVRAGLSRPSTQRRGRRPNQ